MVNPPCSTSDFAHIPDPFGYGERAVRFLRNLRHPKSMLPGKPFQLDPWQEEIVRKIYGPRYPDGRRIVRTVAMMLPRGNRKTSLGAALALLHTIGPENVAGGEVMNAASDRKQARIAYEEALNIIRCDSRISDKVKLTDSRNRIQNPKTGAFMEAVSSDAATAHGHTPVFALVDEIHVWKKRDLWEAIRSGLVKVPGSLLVVISTAGRGQENLAWGFFDYARKVARGEIADESVLPILYEAPRDADWQDEAVWRAVNPGLAYGYPDIEGLRKLAREAAEVPAEREAFKQYNLNIWLDYSADPFVDMTVYDEGGYPVDIDDLEGQRCWLGVDLSSTNDLTSVVACWNVNGDFVVHPWFFCPEERLRERAERDGVSYVRWAEEGLIIPTPGAAVDYRFVEDHIRELCARFEVAEIAFDPHLARNILNNLLEDGFPAVEMRQGWATMAPAVNELERAIIGRRFRHGGHPILRWNFDNIAVQTDSAGNRSFHKGKSRDRIDGAVATAMSVARCAAGDTGVSSYDTFEGDIEEWAYA